MIRAAGILLIQGGKALFLKRGLGADHPGEWCFPGGQVEGDETLDTCAQRETIEEVGFLPAGQRSFLTRCVMPANGPIPQTPSVDAIAEVAPSAVGVIEDVDFTTFLQYTPQAVIPRLSDEHTAYAWAELDTPPEPLHPGCRIALARLNMDELGVAKAMAAGELASPQRYQNLLLIALRVTGTGHAFRKALDEHAYRPPENYLTPEFLERCQGLPVVWEHPAKLKLTSVEYVDRVVGAIFIPYIKGEEVWCIARIHEAHAAEALETYQLSTSPNVVFKEADLTRAKMDDGSTLLIEGKASLLDHLAICVRGVWDKGGPAAGVDAGDLNPEGVVAMADSEDKAKEEQARKDAEEKMKADAEKLDKVLAGIGSLCGRMDAMEEARKADAARMDAEEQARKDAAMSEEEKVKADKARKDADDKAKADAEAEEKVKADKARKDADDKEKEEREKGIADSVKKLVADAVSGLPKADDDADMPAMADAQARADSVYQKFGKQAPRAMQGETPRAYNIRLMAPFLKHSKHFKDAKLTDVPDNTLGGLMESVYADAEVAAMAADDVAPGKLVERQNKDVTGRVISTFAGDPAAWMRQFRPPMRALKKPYFRREAAHAD